MLLHQNNPWETAEANHTAPGHHHGNGLMTRRSVYRNLIICIVLIPFVFTFCTTHPQNDYEDLINQGAFTKAKTVIAKRLEAVPKLGTGEIKQMEFEVERMARIEKDFPATEEEVFQYIKQYIPDVTTVDLRRWEKERSLEYMIIDGEKRYFKLAARNLFRINETCRKIWEKAHPSASTDGFDLDAHISSIIDSTLTHHTTLAVPKTFQITYTLDVKPNAIPEGKVIRCWIPYPREIAGRQTNIMLGHTIPESYKLASNDNLQRTIYLEKKAEKDKITHFQVEYSYVSRGVYVDIDPEKVVPADPHGRLSRYLREEPPHIIFSDSLRALSQRIVGKETNPYLIARKLFAWVDHHITWASAREYSTVRDLSEYAYENRHGDCGMQTMLFITLCRMNGIPARWQSGWEFQPPEDSMHDWGMIYFEPYGWVPVDVTYGERTSTDKRLRWFYLSGMDSYRLIFNDATGCPFSPPKKYFRSETVDSQRGEVEWKGGNLYFDQWQWHMEWKVTDDRQNPPPSLP